MHTSRLLAAVAVGAVVLASCGAAGGGEAATAPPAGGAATEAARQAPAAPELTLTSFSGEQRSLADFHADGPLVVNFWASWCGPCAAEMPDIQAVHQQLGDRVTILGINTQDDPDEAAALAEETGVTYPLVRDPDGTAFRAFGVRGMPTTFYVSADGRVVGQHTGLLTEEVLLEQIRTELLDG